MTKAGQTCLTTCKIPMNERNLLFVSLVTSGVCPGSRFRECARERLRPRPLLNSSTSRSWDTRGLRYGIKGRTPMPRDTGRASILSTERAPVSRSSFPTRSKIDFSPDRLSLEILSPGKGQAWRSLFESWNRSVGIRFNTTFNACLGVTLCTLGTTSIFFL